MTDENATNDASPVAQAAQAAQEPRKRNTKVNKLILLVPDKAVLVADQQFQAWVRCPTQPPAELRDTKAIEAWVLENISTLAPTGGTFWVVEERSEPFPVKIKSTPVAVIARG